MMARRWFGSLRLLLIAVLTVAASGCSHQAPRQLPLDEADAGNESATVVGEQVVEASVSRVPAWATDAIFYQVFPERFRNGDRSNDPTRESLEFPDVVPESWAISLWQGDWYARADWEQAMGPSFYEDGVFHRRYGGDLAGVLEKLDYIADLGVNVIYFNPVFYGKSLHKYDGNTFHHVDPYFGPDPAGDFEQMASETSDPSTWQWTEADKLFLQLIEEAHARGLRIVIDGVFNHTGRDFFAFADLSQRQEDSPYRDWYVVSQFDDPDTDENEFAYQGWWGVDTLPEFANNAVGDDLHTGPKEYIFDITGRWMDPNGDGDSTDGIDGWRLDVANEVPVKFWREWNERVRSLNAEAYTVAEIWDDANRFLADCGFSATMNYHGFAYPVKGCLVDGTLSTDDAARMFDQRRRVYDDDVQYALQNLVDSHDTDRLASMIVNARTDGYHRPDRFDYDVGERVSPRNWDQYDVRKPNDRERRIQRLVVLFQMTYVGAPMVYYGSEAGMWGGDDPCDRMPMVWSDIAYDDQVADPLARPRESDTVEFDVGLHAYYRAAIDLRNRLDVLRRGDIEFVHTDGAAQFIAFRRSDPAVTVYVAINRGNQPYHWTVELEPGESVGQIFTASGNTGQHQVESAGETTRVTVPAWDGAVLRVGN